MPHSLGLKFVQQNTLSLPAVPVAHIVAASILPISNPRYTAKQTTSAASASLLFSTCLILICFILSSGIYGLYINLVCMASPVFQTRPGTPHILHP
ncbi:hypothetical protein GGR55DRAFT_624821 [Xylaria sp. FL0064]|nr:hypothetical protein GGR55DRAFT_624821 [Xylaria sp. FL0064]